MSVTILTSEVVDLISESGIEHKELKGFHKFANRRKAIYIAKGKNPLFTRLDVSGFEPAGDEVLSSLTPEQAKKAHLGAVRGQILPKKLEESVTKEMVLDRIRVLVEEVMSENEGFKFQKKVAESEK